jgi:ABC-type oligopeptide transport system ATPase subunit
MTEPNDVLVETKNLSKIFGRGESRLLAVNEINLQIKRHEIVGLVGESGSGKSTLGKLIVGLLDKSAGEVLYAGKPLPSRYRAADFKHYADRVQMIFQDPYGSLNPRMTVEEIVGEGLHLRGDLTRSEIKQRVQRSLEQVGLSADFFSRYPHEFSGGQRQRIGIARVLIVEPQFIVCDEPISALDVSVQAQVVNLLKDLQREMGLSLLFIAHDLSMVRYISDRILVMYRGRIVESGSCEQVFHHPKHPYTQELIAANPVADPIIERQRRALDKLIT